MAFHPEIIGKAYDLKLEMEYRHYLLKEGMGLYAAYGDYLNAKFGDYFINLYLHFDKKSPSKEMVFGRLHMSFNTSCYLNTSVMAYHLSHEPMDSRVLISLESMKGSAIFIVDVVTKHIFKTKSVGEKMTMQVALASFETFVYPSLEAHEKRGRFRLPLGAMLATAYEDLYTPGLYQVAKTDSLIVRAKDASLEVKLLGEVKFAEKVWHYAQGKRSYLLTHAVVKTDYGDISVVFHKANNGIVDVMPGQIIEAKGTLIGDVAVGLFSGGSYSDA